MSTDSVIHVYDSMTAAETAVRKLNEGHFPIKQVSILAQDMASEKEVHGFITTGDVAKAGAGTGAWVGGLFGILIGAAFIWVPGFGPLFIAGPLAAALLGGAEGAVAGAAGGGLLGALFGLGVSKQQIVKYEETLKAGKFMLVAHGSLEELELARTLLNETETAEPVGALA
ncbi:MAG: DUF1269 domain-containing protein [Ardenticatenaceae bacterium]|nr:hypothetical protein [Anaerolineales bacterium]MCB8981429.1 DUF1269 domain-containing protein [Ardenticatenaceae bacterium]